MDLRRIKYLSCMFEAYLEGKTVQIQYINRWADIKDIGDFKNIFNEFRIKPQRELVPFTFEDHELFKDRWVKNKNSRTIFKIWSVNNEQIRMLNPITTKEAYSYSEFLSDFTFEDGSPCGKYINE